MEDGKIVEYGTHDELMKLGGRYATMVGLQSIQLDKQEKQLLLAGQKRWYMSKLEVLENKKLVLKK